MSLPYGHLVVVDPGFLGRSCCGCTGSLLPLSLKLLLRLHYLLLLILEQELLKHEAFFTSRFPLGSPLGEGSEDMDLLLEGGLELVDLGGKALVPELRTAQDAARGVEELVIDIVGIIIGKDMEGQEPVSVRVFSDMSYK